MSANYYGTQGQDNFSRLVATIANGAAVSGAIPVRGLNIASLTTPAAWTAAAITFQASTDDGATWSPVYAIDSTGAAAETTIPSAGIPTAASRYFQIPAGTFDGASHIKINSGTNAAGTNQGAERQIALGVRRYGGL